ncbi:tachykinin-like peptides receptor 86C [Bolinopsis microptera]|uniref:tachykinin-like peptides receptor 86C n=1 Tax=Bolinopsis microptera TaxID=2820187 RepID=UPI003079EC88
MDEGDVTLNVPKGEPEAIAIWSCVTLLLSIGGSLIILVGSMRHQAIKLNIMSTTLINHIAVADMGFAVFVNGPILLAVLLRKWVFGDFHCKLTELIAQFFCFADFNMICAFAISKLLYLVYPLKAWSQKQARIAALILWTLATVPSVEHAIFINTGLQTYSNFTYGDVYHCTLVTDDGSDRVAWVDKVQSFILMVIPSFLTGGAAVWMLMIVRKVQGLNRQAVSTVVLVTLVYFITCLPIGLLYIFNLHEFKVFRQFAYFIPFLNSSANALIYYGSIKSFRIYIDRGARRLSSNFSNYAVTIGNCDVTMGRDPQLGVLREI